MKTQITDEMVALEYARLTGSTEELAQAFASDLRNKRVVMDIDYTRSLDAFTDTWIRPVIPAKIRKLGKKEKKEHVRLNKWHAFVATPAYEGKVHSDFAQALADSSYRCPFYGVLLSNCIMGNGAFIDLARNIFVRMFLDDHKDCTHLFFIDSDLKWSPDAFVGLIRADLPICAGVYPRRQDDVDYPIRFAEAPDEGGLWVDTIDGLDWIMAERVPTGFLCIRRDVIEEMAAEAPKLDIHGQPGPVPELFYTTRDGSGDIRWDGAKRFVGEDYTFCDNYVKKYGKMIHVWPDIDFVHADRWKGNLLDHLQSEIEAEEAKSVAAA